MPFKKTYRKKRGSYRKKAYGKKRMYKTMRKARGEHTRFAKYDAQGYRAKIMFQFPLTAMTTTDGTVTIPWRQFDSSNVIATGYQGKNDFVDNANLYRYYRVKGVKFQVMPTTYSTNTTTLFYAEAFSDPNAISSGTISTSFFQKYTDYKQYPATRTFKRYYRIDPMQSRNGYGVNSDTHIHLDEQGWMSTDAQKVGTDDWLGASRIRYQGGALVAGTNLANVFITYFMEFKTLKP